MIYILRVYDSTSSSFIYIKNLLTCVSLFFSLIYCYSQMDSNKFLNLLQNFHSDTVVLMWNNLIHGLHKAAYSQGAAVSDTGNIELMIID